MAETKIQHQGRTANNRGRQGRFAHKVAGREVFTSEHHCPEELEIHLQATYRQRYPAPTPLQKQDRIRTWPHQLGRSRQGQNDHLQQTTSLQLALDTREAIRKQKLFPHEHQGQPKMHIL